MKLLLILAIGLLVVWMLRKGRLPPPDAAPRRPPPGAADAPPGVPQAMVRCSHCGLHLPQADALPAPAGRADRHYCCAEHLRLGEARARAARP